MAIYHQNNSPKMNGFRRDIIFNSQNFFLRFSSFESVVATDEDA